MSIKFKFPGGAGGHWLSHLCYCLENNDYELSKKDINFHNHKLSKNVVAQHWVENPAFLLSSKYKFNLYLNAVCKNEIYKIPNDWHKNTDLYISQTRFMQSKEYQNSYQKNIDIDISWTVTDPIGFLDKLFNILDTNNIKYSKNLKLLNLKIKQYVDTCIDPYKHIGNLESKYWQVWCLGFLDYNDVLVSYRSQQEIAEMLSKNNNYFIEKTLQWSYRLW